MGDEDNQGTPFVFDPRMFIHRPYRQCPSCGADGAFGVLRIGPYHYVRRCRECWHDASFPLPELKKRVLYLDQFAISDMMKALNPKVDREVDRFWLDLFRRVDRLCKLQLLICPDSSFHWQESAVSSFAPALRRMCDQLSAGVTLHHPHEIERIQIFEHVQRWVEGRESDPWEFDLAAVISGDPGAWQDRLMVLAQSRSAGKRIEGLRQSRDAADKQMLGLFRRWQHEKPDFWDCFRKEARSPILAPSERGDVHSVLTVEAICEALKTAGIAESDWRTKTHEYLTSDAVERLPFKRMFALLAAALSRRAARGQKRVPRSGMLNDIRFISTFLPYCDAILVDRECYQLMIEPPLRDEFALYRCRVFCKNTKDELMSYLEGIEADAPAEHLATVKAVYGEGWDKPYETMYADNQT